MNYFRVYLTNLEILNYMVQSLGGVLDIEGSYTDLDGNVHVDVNMNIDFTFEDLEEYRRMIKEKKELLKSTAFV